MIFLHILGSGQSQCPTVLKNSLQNGHPKIYPPLSTTSTTASPPSNQNSSLQYQSNSSQSELDIPSPTLSSPNTTPSPPRSSPSPSPFIPVPRPPINFDNSLQSELDTLPLHFL